MDSSSSNPVTPKNGGEPIITDFIDITIKTIDSKNFQFQVENDIQIKAFKERIAEEVGIDTESQRMIFCGRVLSDEKTLKEYKIDSGKTIHLVKKAAPAPQPRTSTASTPNAGNDANRNRFHSYRSEDGSVFMGTISLDSPNNILNQMVRSLFTGSRAAASPNASGAGGGAASGDDSANTTGSSDGGSGLTGQESIRTRINYVRRFLSYIATNFQILDNPNLFPSIPPPVNESAEPVVSVAEYGELFREAFAISDRLRPHITRQMTALAAATTEAEARAASTSHSILMRISHHLSHIIHMLSEFNIDLTAAPNFPLTLNTLDTSMTNGAAGAAAAAASSAASAASAAASSLLANLPNLSARIEISTPTTTAAATGGSGGTSTIPGFQASIPATFSRGGYHYHSHPVLLMEVDTNINVSQNFIQELSRSLSSSLGASVNASFGGGPPTAGAAAASSSSTGETTSTTTTTTSSTSAATSSRTSTATTANNETTTSSTVNNAASAPIDSDDSSADQHDHEHEQDHDDHDHHHHHHHHFNLDQLSVGLTFDPFLSCNSSYTIPEVRSASNIVGDLQGGLDIDPMDDDDNGLDPHVDESLDPRIDGDGNVIVDWVRTNPPRADVNAEQMRAELRETERVGESLNRASTPPSQLRLATEEEEEQLELMLSPSERAAATTASAPTAEKRDEAIDALYDSEGEFADAISDFPSTTATLQKMLATPGVALASTTGATTSSTSSSTATSDVPANWQSILPNEWIPVIEADIQRQQSSLDGSQQQQKSEGGPVFSDAYLNGMPKKRRLEYKPEEEGEDGQKQHGDAKQQRPH